MSSFNNIRLTQYMAFFAQVIRKLRRSTERGFGWVTQTKNKCVVTTRVHTDLENEENHHIEMHKLQTLFFLKL